MSVDRKKKKEKKRKKILLLKKKKEGEGEERARGPTAVGGLPASTDCPSRSYYYCYDYDDFFWVPLLLAKTSSFIPSYTLPVSARLIGPLMQRLEDIDRTEKL